VATLDFMYYLRIIWKWLWLIILAGGLAAGTSYYSLRKVPHVYTSSTTILVGNAVSDLNPNSSEFSTAQNLAETYSQMAQSQMILQATVKALKLPYSWQALAARIIVVHQLGSQIIEIRAVDVNPVAARDIAAGLADQLIAASPTEAYLKDLGNRRKFITQQLDDLQAKIQQAKDQIAQQQAAMAKETSARGVLDRQDQINAIQLNLNTWQGTYASLLSSYQADNSPNVLTVIVPASVPTQADGPRVLWNVALAGVAGVAVALIGVLVIEYLDDTVKTKADLEELLDAPALGAVPRINLMRQPGSQIVVANDPESAAAEAYRAIGVNLRLAASLKDQGMVVLITSPGPREGKSLSAANLAAALAEGGKSVLLVDLDLRNPCQHTLFSAPNVVGVTSLLLHPGTRIEDCIVGTSVARLSLMTAGPAHPATAPSRLIPADLLSQFGEQLVDSLRHRADFVVIDGPPVLAAADAVILGTLLDGVLLVVRAAETRRGRGRDAAETLRRAHAHILGTVLNAAPTDDLGMYGYPYRRRASGGVLGLPWGRRQAPTA
jgi:succinoglycan biosynthesis transport protein ExoP